MTESRLIDIKRNIMDDVSPLMDELILLAMKQAVNEALDEAADRAQVTDDGEDFADSMGIESEYGIFTVRVHKQSILNLKVK